jgi:hypothetical protein
VREFAIDRENTSGGSIRYFWNVGKAFWHAGKGYVPLHKVGGFGKDFFTRSEGCLICIPNLDTERDPSKLNFLTLPDGDAGIRAPLGGGPIAEEHSFTELSDGSLFTVFRTISGHPACAYSRDGGHTWSKPGYVRYPDGRKVKNPRAANFIWRLSGGRYLYWFHNHSGRNYADRNPVWCLAAREIAGQDGCVLEFSQPEILLYADEFACRMSYPDCLELSTGELLLTETEKRVARLHRIPAWFLRCIGYQWQQAPVVADEDCLVDVRPGVAEGDYRVAAELPLLQDRNGSWEQASLGDLRTGFTISMQLDPHAVAGVLADNRDSHGYGICLSLEQDRRLQVTLADSRSRSQWRFSLPLSGSEEHFVSVIVDGGPKTLCAVIDGQFDDGGDRQFGFGLFHPHLGSVRGCGQFLVATAVRRLLIHRRALLTAEAVSLSTLSIYA